MAESETRYERLSSEPIGMDAVMRKHLRDLSESTNPELTVVIMSHDPSKQQVDDKSFESAMLVGGDIHIQYQMVRAAYKRIDRIMKKHILDGLLNECECGEEH